MRAMRSPVFLLILVLMLLMIAPACGETAAEDPVVVRVGSISYPLSVVQASLDGTLDVASALLDTPVSDEDRQAGVEAAIEKFVNMGLIENKLTEAGKNDFTQSEDELLKGAAQNKYEELWQILYQRMKQSNEEVSEEDVTDIMDAQGYTVEALYDEYLLCQVRPYAELSSDGQRRRRQAVPLYQAEEGRVLQGLCPGVEARRRP